jgi:hypothetical protein
MESADSTCPTRPCSALYFTGNHRYRLCMTLYHHQSPVHKQAPIQPHHLRARIQRRHHAFQPHCQSPATFVFGRRIYSTHLLQSCLSIGQLCDDGCTATFPPPKSLSNAMSTLFPAALTIHPILVPRRNQPYYCPSSSTRCLASHKRCRTT